MVGQHVFLLPESFAINIITCYGKECSAEVIFLDHSLLPEFLAMPDIWFKKGLELFHI